jgi:hypothetical protein
MLAPLVRLYHILISLCDINDLYRSPGLRLGPKLINVTTIKQSQSGASKLDLHHLL